MKTWTRIIIYAITAVCLLGFALPVLAWDDCPLGLVDDPYPGACRRYVDTNGDGICDHSQSDPSLTAIAFTEPTVAATEEPIPTLSEEPASAFSSEPVPIASSLPSDPDPAALVPDQSDAPSPSTSTRPVDLAGLSSLSNRTLRVLTMQELEDTYGYPVEVLLPVLAEMGIEADSSATINTILRTAGLSRTSFLQLLNSKETAAVATPLSTEASLPPSSSPPSTMVSTSSPTPSRSPSLPVAGLGASQRGGGAPWMTQEVGFLLATCALLLLLKGAALIRTASNGRQMSWFRVGNHRWLLNLLLTVSFALSFLFGLLDFFALNFGWFSSWGSLIVAVHLDSSMALLPIAVVHTFWHLPYYRNCYRRGRSLQKNPKVYSKWVLNLILTAAFLISLVSGLLDLLVLRTHWFLGTAPILLDIHLYSSLVMMAVGLVHALWHLAYYRSRLAPARLLRTRHRVSLPSDEAYQRA
ncbi:MAG: DUF4405 domain-containing protein [Coprothermobacterota bacterium]|nr:DUF4405 domain-containing protein [Coprothermobacterota bacterium]